MTQCEAKILARRGLIFPKNKRPRCTKQAIIHGYCLAHYRRYLKLDEAREKRRKERMELIKSP